mmetsp:Transcript_46634/g.52968  ORF Transcript_46634/g.52968 Transcript_46634/m.52968 type:complete len:422 (+) Transcript_46634:121-1386(+)
MVALKQKKNCQHSSATTFSILFISCLPLFAVAKTCNVIAEGTTFDPNNKKMYTSCDIFILHDTFQQMLDGRNKDDENSGIQTLLNDSLPIFHEGPVLFEDALYFTTNRLGTFDDPVWGGVPETLSLDQYVDIMKLDFATLTLSNLTEFISPKLLMANGMTKTADGKNILALSQGFNSTGGGIYEINRESLVSTPIVTSFYGHHFNSPNDLEITHDGILFFSDPVYGFEQGFREGLPPLGSNVYRYDTNTKRQTIVAERLQRPNGVALFDDRKNGNGCQIFLSDSGFEEKDQTARGFNGFGDSLLYTKFDKGDGCFAPEDSPWVLQPLIPVGSGGIQDGMKVHTSSKTLLYCDNVHGMWIFSIPLNRNIGLVKQPCTQLIFSQQEGLQTIYILNETTLWTIQLNFVVSSETEESYSSPKSDL